MYRAFWWLCYTLAGIWLQEFLPGVDFLAPGLLLAMQEERPGAIAWLVVAWVIIQEGTGGLIFCFCPAWYGGLVVFYQVGRWLFDQKSFLFVCLTGLLFGLWMVGLTLALVGLEETRLFPEPLLVRALLQAALFPVVWWLASSWYPERLKSHERPA